MTLAQKMIFKHVKQNFEPGSVTCMPIGTSSMKVTDKTGGSMLLTVNPYGDIMDEKTSEIYEVSKEPYDFEESGRNPRALPADLKKAEPEPSPRF